MSLNNDQRIAGLVALAAIGDIEIRGNIGTLHARVSHCTYQGAKRTHAGTNTEDAIDAAILEALPAHKAALEATKKVRLAPAYPTTLTPALAEILGQPCFTFIQLAQVWREAGLGNQIPERAEGEQAFFIDKHLRLYMQHGDDWRKAFGAELQQVIDKVQGMLKATESGGENGHD